MRLFEVSFLSMLLLSACVRAEVTYEEALDVALERGDPGYCRRLTSGRFFGDYVENTDSARLFCVSEFVANKGYVSDCLELDNTRPDGVSQRHSCLGQLARTQRNLEACNLIAYPESDRRAENNLGYQDRCRADAIWELGQCVSGFQTQAWAGAVGSRCIQKVAENTLDPTLCDQLSSAEEVDRCKLGVQWRILPPAGP